MPSFLWKASPSPFVACCEMNSLAVNSYNSTLLQLQLKGFCHTLLMSFCFSRLTISSMISPSPLTSLQDSRGEKDHQFNQGGGILPPNSHSCGTLSPAYLVLPVSGSTTLRITLCLASYSSLVRGLLVDSRAFCSSVMTGEAKMHQRGGNNQMTISE